MVCAVCIRNDISFINVFFHDPSRIVAVQVRNFHLVCVYLPSSLKRVGEREGMIANDWASDIQRRSSDYANITGDFNTTLAPNE